MADQTAAIDASPRPEASSTVLQIAVLAGLAATGTLATNILLPSLPQMAVSLKVSSAAVTSAITIFLAVFAVGQLVVGPISDRYGRRWPVLIGFAVFFAGSIWCGLATDLPSLLVGRVIQAAGACATSVLSRAIARDMFSGRRTGARDGADHDRDGGGPRLLAAARRRARPLFRLAFRICARRRLCRRSARLPMAPCSARPITRRGRRSIRLAIARNYIGLIADRRFVVPAATVSLIMGGLFSVFSAAPRVLIEAMHFTPIQLGLFFAGTVLIVFAAGMLATKLAPRYGLDRSIRGGLFAAATGSIAMLLVSLYSPSFLPFLGAMSVFLLGMGIVNPLGTAQALSPFGDKAGAASALVGFWQMMTAAIGVWLAATISHEALFALGVVLTVFSLAAVGLYTMRTKG